jgi:hypothetical protein
MGRFLQNLSFTRLYHIRPWGKRAFRENFFRGRLGRKPSEINEIAERKTGRRGQIWPLFPGQEETAPLTEKRNPRILTAEKENNSLQGGVRFPTGGTAHEPQGMIR